MQGLGRFWISRLVSVGGWLQVLTMLDATRPFMESVTLTMPYLQARSVGGIMMTAGHIRVSSHKAQSPMSSNNSVEPGDPIKEKDQATNAVRLDLQGQFYQNLIWAVVYNAILLPAAVLGFCTSCHGGHRQDVECIVGIHQLLAHRGSQAVRLRCSKSAHRCRMIAT